MKLSKWCKQWDPFQQLEVEKAAPFPSFAYPGPGEIPHSFLIQKPQGRYQSTDISPTPNARWRRSGVTQSLHGKSHFPALAFAAD